MSQEITQYYSWILSSAKGSRPVRLGHGLRGLAGAVAGRFARARQRRLLLGLDDHLLRDIGVTRADALREAGKPFWS